SPPPQVVLAAGLAASTRSAGRLSVRSIPAIALTVRLNTVMVSCEVWPEAMLVGLKTLVTSTASIIATLLEAVLVLLVAPPGPSPEAAVLVGNALVMVAFVPAPAGTFARKVMVHRPGDGGAVIVAPPMLPLVPLSVLVPTPVKPMPQPEG